MLPDAVIVILSYQSLSRMRNLNWLHYCFAVFAVLYFAGPTGTPLVVPGIMIPVARFLVLYFSVCVVVIGYRRSLYTAMQSLWLWLFFLLSVASLAWSVRMESTLENVISFIHVLAFSLYFSTYFKLRQQLQVVAFAFLLGAGLSAIAVVLMPEVGTMAEFGGAWRGLFHHKNVFGSYMGLASVACFLLASDRQRPAPWAWWGLACCFGMVLLSTSKGALVVSVASLSVTYFFRSFAFRGRLAVALIHICILVFTSLAGLLLQNWTALITSLGKDPTLTGRIPIWNFTLLHLLERPLFGYGLGAFYSQGSPFSVEAGLLLDPSGTFVTPGAHNGYIELAVDMGLVGITLFLVFMIGGYLRAILQAYGARGAGELWPLACLTFFLLNNVVEGFPIYGEGPYAVSVLAALFSLSKLVKQQRREALRAEAERSVSSTSVAANSKKPAERATSSAAI